MIEIIQRNRRLAAFIVVIIVLIVLNIMFFMQWQTAGDEKSKVETEKKTADVNLQVANAQYDLDELRAEEAELSRSPEFPTSLPIVDLSVFLANGAAQFHVNIDKVTPPTRIGTEKIGSGNFPSYATELTVNGSLTQVISYLKYVENSAYRSVKLDKLTCASSGATWTCKFTVIVISQA